MQLHCNVLFVVHLCKLAENESSVGIGFHCCRLLASDLILEDSVHILFAPEGAWTCHKGVVRCLTSHFNKEIKSLFKCIYNISHTLDFHICTLSKFLDIRSEIRLVDVEGLVRAIGWDDLCRAFSFISDYFVPLEVICRIVCSSHCIYVELLHDSPDCKIWIFAELFVCFFIDLFGILSIQYIIDSEVSLKFQMCPMVERVSNEILHCLGPSCEL